MKILIFTDNHFCETSSIVRKFGTKYTIRLENQIESLNWVEDTALKNNCDLVVCAGDFFDKPTLTDMELTALQDIRWQPSLEHLFLVGNHESSVNGLRFNSVKSLERKPIMRVVSEPIKLCDAEEGFDLCFLPYVIESDRKSIKDYFGERTDRKRIIISHNDIKGLQMGMIVSQTGFEIADFEANSDLTVNGHLHNGQKVSGKVVNLGNLTGQNFSEDAFRYKHNVMILDTTTLKYELIENPHAFNFYKLSVKDESDIAQLSKLKNNSIVSINCAKSMLESLQNALDSSECIIESRVITIQDPTDSATVENIADLTVDHIAKFIDCAKERLGNGKILQEELAEICK